MKKSSKRSVFRIVWFSLVGIFMVWNIGTYQSRNLPSDTFENSEKVSVEVTKDQIIFKSNLSNKSLEVIFFQGALVDPKAYAPLSRKLAEAGFTTHLIKTPFRLPLYGYQKISEIFDLEEGNYVIGGHSQGGKMAARFVFENPELLKGLFLLGTSHPRDIDLSNLSIPSLKLYGELDGLASVEEVEANESKLPTGCQSIMIEGGNHSQFGYIGTLLTDNPAGIPLEKQQELTLSHLKVFLNGIENSLLK